MIFVLLECTEPFDALLKKIQGSDVLLVDPSCVESKEQLELAYYLANKSFEQKTNIARDFKLEFLLWLTGKRDIRSAMEAAKPKNSMVLAIIFSGSKKKIIDTLGAKELKLKFKKTDPITLEKISLSRII